MNRKRPICTGVDANGELTWSMVPMELWEILQLYRRQYHGDFGEQWMRLLLMEKYAIDWAG